MRGAHEGFRIKTDEKISQIFTDFEFCETFGWDLFTLYSQPKKRMIEFSIIMDERNLIRKSENEKMKSKMRR